MSRRRTIPLLCVAAATAIIVLTQTLPPHDQPVRVRYAGYGDYYGGPWSPRQVEFQVLSRRRTPIRVWGTYRVEFMAAKAMNQTVASDGVTLPRADQATDIQIRLTGNERGTWRLVVPVSDYRIVDFLERWIGRGAVVKFADSLLQRSPRWVASKWMAQLPQRSPNPPDIESRGEVHQNR